MSHSISVALFGSTARGDIDEISDIDVLVAADSRDSASHVLQDVTSRGWHPTFFTWKRLVSSALDGDLFVRHLQLESRILVDPDERLAHTLASFRHCSSYERRFRKASELLVALQAIPNHPKTALWLLDAAAVAYRALAVARLADMGIECFSMRAIHAGLSRVGAVRASEPSTYRWLRRCKSLYRNRSSTWIPISRVLRDAYVAIDKTFRLGAHFRIVDPEYFASVCLSHTEKDLGWYARSRRLEGLLQLLISKDAETNLEFEAIRRSLIRPSDYESCIALSLPMWESTVSSIAFQDGTSIVPFGAPPPTYAQTFLAA